MWYDYKHNIKEDIKEWLNDTTIMHDKELLTEDDLYNMLIDNDHITGGGSGNYCYQSNEEATACVIENFDLLHKCIEENGLYNKKDVSGVDVFIRCCLLRECIQEVLNELKGDN